MSDRIDKKKRYPVVALAGVGLLISALFGNTAMAGFEEGVEAHRAGDYAAALKEFEPSAVDGDVRSQFMLAEMLRLGQGLEQNMEFAAKWYQAAAESGHPAAMNAVGTLYAMGKGVEQDDVQAYVWFTLGAMMGNATAEKNLERAKALIGRSNRKFGDQMLRQYIPVYVLPYRPELGFTEKGEGAWQSAPPGGSTRQ